MTPQALIIANAKGEAGTLIDIFHEDSVFNADLFEALMHAIESCSHLGIEEKTSLNPHVFKIFEFTSRSLYCHQIENDLFCILDISTEKLHQYLDTLEVTTSRYFA